MYPTSSTTYAQAQAGGGILRLVSPQDPRTGHPHHQFNHPPPHQMSNPAPWGSVPYQPLSPLGVPTSSFNYTRPPPESPPALIHSQSPYASIPLPRQLDLGVCVSMNPLLKYASHYLLQWDITTPPGCASSWSTSPTWLTEPAVRPNLRTFAIWMKLPTGMMDKPIVIHARDNVGVTVHDVLKAIYHNVQAAIDSVPGCYGNRNEAVRVLFGGHKVFAGLTESTTESDVWVLHVR